MPAPGCPHPTIILAVPYESFCPTLALQSRAARTSSSTALPSSACCSHTLHHALQLRVLPHSGCISGQRGESLGCELGNCALPRAFEKQITSLRAPRAFAKGEELPLNDQSHSWTGTALKTARFVFRVCNRIEQPETVQNTKPSCTPSPPAICRLGGSGGVLQSSAALLSAIGCCPRWVWWADLIARKNHQCHFPSANEHHCATLGKNV